ncbi:unnamed protein product [Paramecium octaurelia]|uniref:Uncharacterized protein n=1 Tax=Paramecium octaurelia TaxID=43137 RepID=A0A8S1UKE6_PAROT|nr:unnamed protein product [Paramecium octaurelia]
MSVDKYFEKCLEFLQNNAYIGCLIYQSAHSIQLLKAHHNIAYISIRYSHLYSVYVYKQGLNFSENLMGLMMTFTLYKIIRRQKMSIESMCCLFLVVMVYWISLIPLLFNSVELQKQVNCHQILVEIINEGDGIRDEKLRSDIQSMLQYEYYLSMTNDDGKKREDIEKMRQYIEEYKLQLCFGTPKNDKTPSDSPDSPDSPDSLDSPDSPDSPDLSKEGKFLETQI